MKMMISVQEGEEQFDSRPSVPSDGYGLGLTGNRNNYYDVRNSMLHQVRKAELRSLRVAPPDALLLQ